MVSETVRLRGRPAHTPGTTHLAFTLNGKYLVTAGSDSSVRIFTVGEDDEPKTIDTNGDEHTGIVATNDCFILGAPDGTVWKYNLKSGGMDQLLFRCLSPVRDLCLSNDGEWVAVASDSELVVRVVSVDDMTAVKYLREQTKGVKHVSFHPSGKYVATSSLDGIVYIYSMVDIEPLLVTKIDGVIKKLNPNDDATCLASWHPDGKAFGVADSANNISVVSVGDWKRQEIFCDGHHGDITAICWSPNGAFLVTAGVDGQIILWETRTQNILKRYNIPNVLNLAWHPFKNILSFTTSEGELFIHNDFVPEQYRSLFSITLESSPLMVHKSRTVETRNVVALPKDTNGHKRRRADTPDSLNDILGSNDYDEGSFIEDDDGAGYVPPHRRGRYPENYNPIDYVGQQRLDMSWRPNRHKPFQPGSTPWRGGRRYLCLNLIGSIWSVEQGGHNSVTVEFYDRQRYKDFHFTDPYLYDKACLNERGTLFSCQPWNKRPAIICYRPHETWTIRSDWKTQLLDGESIRAISLSDSFIVVTTSTNYVRVYTLFGIPYKLYRQKSENVTCTAWKDYILTVGNGSISGTGSAQLTYSIENIKQDEICQNEDVVALPQDTYLSSVMFSDTGDPCIFDSTGVLLILLHWRTPGQARWVPLLDTKLMDRLASGRRNESYWPVAVTDHTFHCIVLKGSERYPFFPKPLLSEFQFKIPLSASILKGSDEDDVSASTAYGNLEESLVRTFIMKSLLEDRLAESKAMIDETGQLRRKDVEIDKILLQLLASECRSGEDRSMRALELVSLIQDNSGKMFEAASKIAMRYGRTALDTKIHELAERRLLAEEYQAAQIMR